MGFSETQLGDAGVGTKMIRSLLSFFDQAFFGVLMLVYQLFFNVASVDIFSNDTMMKFYGRVQLILGVFMLFQLAMTVIKGLVNPDSFADSKSGMGSVIYRIVVALIMLTILVPINIPNAKNEYEAQINNNGLLFGTLYSLQHRLLENNTIGRLILGTSEDADSNYLTTPANKNDKLKRSSRLFTSTILKAFYRINLIPEDQRKHEDGRDDAEFNDNRVCTNIPGDILDKYTSEDADPGEIISFVNETCSSTASYTKGNTSSSKKYMFAYMPIIPLIVAGFFSFLLISFTIDVAVRAVKLAILRLIAPIPIISYMDPKGGKDAAFNAWVKTLTSTYLDLFIRLGSVFFALFLIEEMLTNGIVMNTNTGVLGFFSMIAIWVGLFVFAKQAPKFIKSAMGIKDDGGKLFSGFGEIMSAKSVVSGAVGGAISKGNAAHLNGGNVGSVILNGIGGFVGGGFNAGKTYYTSKDANAKAIKNANRAYNEKNYSNASDDSTFHGRFVAGIQGDLGLRNQQQRMDDKMKSYSAADAAVKRAGTILDNDEHKFGTGYFATITDGGDTLISSAMDYSVNDLKKINDRVQASSRYSDATKKAVEKMYKDAQGERVRAIVSTPNVSSLSADERAVYDSLETVSKVAHKYANEPEFNDRTRNPGAYYAAHTSFSATIWGHFKGAGGTASRQADQIKNSSEYATAKANANRADQVKK